MTYSSPPPTTGPQRLGISILEAHGLQHMNHFTGDHPYATCEIKHYDQAKSTKIETKPVTEGDTQNPFWGETHYLDSWRHGEPLEFTIYDKGLIGSKTEGKAVLPSEMFSPQGFTTVADTTYHCGCSLSLGPKCGRSQTLPHYSCEQ